MEVDTKPHLEEKLAGGVRLPMNISLKSFSEARMQEIAALTEAVEDPLRKGLIFQRLPKHMRRRAMGHNAKRMPKNLQKSLTASLEKCGVKDQPKSKPRRKYRRRPQNLLSEYNRRQRDFVWLETHIWHAKRFHMINKWGYKLADFPNDKCFRACYRASAQHCLLQDISYYNCIEIRGNLTVLLNGFKLHTSPECGLTFSAKCLLDGSRQGNVIFFKRNLYPRYAIGEVSFIWRPEVTVGDTKTIWIWIHPAYYSEILTEIITTFELEQVVKKSEENFEMVCEETKENFETTKSVDCVKFELRTRLFNKTPEYLCERTGVSMHLLKDTLNRFRLIGPLSQAVITEAFQVADLNFTESLEINSNNWYKQYCCNNKSRIGCFKLQKEMWEKFKKAVTPAQLPPSCVFSLNIVDPRLSMPCKRTKAITEAKVTECKEQILPDLGLNIADSPLWCYETRDLVTKEKVSSQELSDQRSTKIVPGLEVEQINCNANPQSIPVIFIQQPGNSSNQRLGYGAGWDLIIPCGWGMPVWNGLVYRGARTGGLREAECLQREMGKLPLLSPDTSAGKLEDEKLESILKEEYFRKPPAKRHNFIKLGISSPFKCPWNILAREWSGSNLFYVLRNKLKLRYLENSLHNLTNVGNKVNDLKNFFTDDEGYECLVPVSVVYKGKGTLNKFAQICCPSNLDMENLKTNQTFLGPVEPIHEDLNRKKRDEIKTSHKSVLMKLKRKRTKQRKKCEVRVKDGTKLTEEIVKTQKEKMEELWVPVCTKVKNITSRLTIGFVVDGAFSFTESCSSGQGYIHLSAIFSLLETLQINSMKFPIVLVRPIHSNQFRFASLKIII